MKFCPICGEKFSTQERCIKHGRKLLELDRNDPLVGRWLNRRYLVSEKIGSGGMGIVYKGYQKSAERFIALKILKNKEFSDEKSIRRFLREAQIASQLVCPHTVKIYDMDVTDDGIVYIVMELLEGQTLRDVLAEKRSLDIKYAQLLICQILDSLDEAHAKGIVHRDLKPENIFILDNPRLKNFVKVMDFGIAKDLINRHGGTTSSSNIVGTPAYMSPEQSLGKSIDIRSDLYALGVIFYEMLSGVPPFSGGNALDLVLKKMHQRPSMILEINPSARVPAGIQEIIFKLLSPNPDDRYSSALQVKREILEASDGTILMPPSTSKTIDANPLEEQTTPSVDTFRETTAVLVKRVGGIFTGKGYWVIVWGLIIAIITFLALCLSRIS